LSFAGPAHCKDIMEALTVISVQAARLIRNLGSGGSRRKPDGSPVTPADEAAEAVICEGIASLGLALPIVSEEQAEHTTPAVPAGAYFLIDPLDGTLEFIAGRDEYTINIALITEGRPALGVITAPALGLIWRGMVGDGAERLTLGSDGRVSPPVPIHTRRADARDIVVAVSRSHLDEQTRAFVAGLPQAKTLACGSALKFCRVADGSADLYPRLGPTRDWDVAAGHALVIAAGGRVTAPDGTSLIYGSPERLIPGFIARGDPGRETV
jgi:3'(2'), 5'-bisphosphate nucleotidase